MNKTTTLFTIGFTKKNAERFFTLLKDAGVQKVIDVRLNNVSQLAGFAKKDDLQFFLKGLHGIGYEHMTELAPTQEMLDEYKKQGMDWAKYEVRFLDLIKSRHIESLFTHERFDRACLLCSEDGPRHCHRRLVTDYLSERYPEIEIVHLK